MNDFPKILVIYLPVDWNLFNRREMVHALAESVKKYGSTVIAVNRPLCPFTTIITKRHRVKELFLPSRIEKLQDNLILFSPKYFLHDHLAGRIRLFEKMNSALLRKSLTKLFRQTDISCDKPLVWYNYPQQGYIYEIFDSSFIIFEIYDFLSDISGRENQELNNLERKYKGKVDLFLTASEVLHKKYSSAYKNSFIFGNGLSLTTYETLKNIQPRQRSKTDRPKIGYSGMVSNRLDWDLIEQIAINKPEWDIIFYGLIANPSIPEKLRRYKNIIFHGPFTQKDLPSILSKFHVGILPYSNNEFSQHLNPLKFFEYAAAGLPIVSTSILELERFSDSLISIPDYNADKWIEAIEKQLSVDRLEMKTIGLAIAEKYTWDNLCEKLIIEIKKLYS
ncbi:MAG: glycosyltransferase [Candidatus Zixiibacteriota bacterium]